MIKGLSLITSIIYLGLFLILIINMRKKNKIIKYSFVILFSIILVIMFINNESLVNSLIRIVIEYLYFPSIDIYMFTLIITIGILIYSIINEKIYDKVRILNYIFASLIIVSYIIFALLKVDINSYNALYSNYSLICLRYGTRTFTIWIIVLSSIKYCRFFLSKRW